MRRLLPEGLQLLRGFLSPAEEGSLLVELEGQLKRGRYQGAHWDNVGGDVYGLGGEGYASANSDVFSCDLKNWSEVVCRRAAGSEFQRRVPATEKALSPIVTMLAIHGFREIEKSSWTEQNSRILQRVREVAFPPGVPQLSLVHVLDLQADGYIKPHIDSVKFCGSTIAGLSLLSSSVMRLVSEHNKALWTDLLLERRSLYILSGKARYEFTHEVLKDEESIFNGKKIPRERRISVICRNLPEAG